MIRSGSFIGLLAAFGGAACSRPEEPKPAPRRESSATSQGVHEVTTTATSAPSVAAVPGTLARVRVAAGKILGTELTDKSDDVPFAALPKPADDLDVVETILAIEEEFEIEIPDEALGAFDKPEQGGVALQRTVRLLSLRSV